MVMTSTGTLVSMESNRMSIDVMVMVDVFAVTANMMPSVALPLLLLVTKCPGADSSQIIGSGVGRLVGFKVGLVLGKGVVGPADGSEVGLVVGSGVDTGEALGPCVGGSETGEALGSCVGESLTGAELGSNVTGAAVGGSDTGEAVGG